MANHGFKVDDILTGNEKKGLEEMRKQLISNQYPHLQERLISGVTSLLSRQNLTYALQDEGGAA